MRQRKLVCESEDWALCLPDHFLSPDCDSSSAGEEAGLRDLQHLLLSDLFNTSFNLLTKHSLFLEAALFLRKCYENLHLFILCERRFILTFIANSKHKVWGILLDNSIT